ncbi:MAG: pilus assembly protein PilY [Methylophaga sp.]|nr:pilus assembly protein PilY [Methylophaga sp.]
MKNTFKKCLQILCLATLSTTSVNSSELNLSQVPLYLTTGVDPNIMFIIDDSGSMMWETIPDELTYRFFTGNINTLLFWLFPPVHNLHGGGEYFGTGNANWGRIPHFDIGDFSAHVRSAHNNPVYYNPAITYRPWVNADGTVMANASPSAAMRRPLHPGFGTFNLTQDFTHARWWNSDGTTDNTSRSVFPATYYHYIGGDEENRNSYDHVEIKPENAPFTGHGRENRTDCASAPSCTYHEEIQNFANWYSYYRNRIFASRAGIGRAFVDFDGGMRVGYGTINHNRTTTSNLDGIPGRTVVQGVRDFSGANKTAFFDVLYNRPIPAQGTPLRRALEGAGEYFSRNDVSGPWSDTPGIVSPGESSADHLSCRQSFTILMTDGYTTGDFLSAGYGAADSTRRANIDGTSSSVTNLHPTNPALNYTYTPIDPFQDGMAHNLADVAMYYWQRDLRPDLDNRVPTSSVNEAFWQHMVTFGIGLGVSGSINPDDAWQAFHDGTTINWPDPEWNFINCGNSPNARACAPRIDDLLHAAINSRGGFFSVDDPDSFAAELQGVLSNIVDRTSSAASVALNSGTISGDTRVYQARFESGGWTGQLLAYQIESNGTLGALEWDAGSLMLAANSRVIVSHDGTNGVPFRWNNLSASQQSQLLSENVLNYVRGEQANEITNGGTFRNRSRVLGDIINSSPVFSGAPNSRYPDNWGIGAAENAQPYRNFRVAQANRTPLVLVGANDGMLHGFNATTGVEIFAYVPASVISNLPLLTDPNYNHRYYVDGNPTIVDAFINGVWKTILVSGLGAGGQGIFALDITDPDSFSSEAGASANVLWEFTDFDDRDMGYTLGQPSIVRLNNGSWAAIFSGGYNNTADNGNTGDSTNDSLTGNAVLYIVDLATGDLIRKFDTGVGRAQDPTGNNRPNGLASPAVVDINGNYSADAVYAGDLFGNVWKINLAGNDPASWNFAYLTGGIPQPLFTACHGTICNASNLQPITTRPQVVRHPSGAGYIVLFGTGQYMEVGDNAITGQTTQSYYAIWDKAQPTLTPFNRGNLLEQEIMFEINQANGDFRVTSDTSIDWSSHNGWFMDLQYGADNFGERQVSNALVRSNRIIFTTLLPSVDPCEFGGSGWLMELDIFSGARLPFSPFDLNNDGVFDINDFINVGDITGDGNDDYLPASGRKSTVGIIPTPSIVNDTGGQREYKFLSGSSGEIEVITENPGPGETGRQSWYPLDFIFQ